MAEVFTPILLNGFMRRSEYSADCLEALSGWELTSDIFFKSFLVLGALCYHSGMNELGDKSARLSIPHNCCLTV